MPRGLNWCKRGRPWDRNLVQPAIAARRLGAECDDLKADIDRHAGRGGRRGQWKFWHCGTAGDNAPRRGCHPPSEAGQ